MTDVFLMRHPEARRRLFDNHGDLYGLTEKGEQEARVAGRRLLEVTNGRIPVLFERESSLRSRQAALLVAGEAGVSTQITEQTAFDRTGLTPEEIHDNMLEWLSQIGEEGPRLAVMSQLAILSCIGYQLGWSLQEIADPESHGQAALPTGSFTHLSVKPGTGEFNMHYYGRAPFEAASEILAKVR